MELTRGVSPAVMSALQGPVYPILMAHLDWPDAPVRAHTGVGDIVWGGYTWRGVGPVGSMDVPSEAMGGVVSVDAVLSLVGVPADLDGMADDKIRSRPVDVYIGIVSGRPGGHDGRQTSGPGSTLVGDPISLFSGTMDGLSLEAQQSGVDVEHTASVTVTTGPSARSMATVYHSDEDQRRHYPSDTAGRHLILSLARAQKLRWPEN